MNGCEEPCLRTSLPKFRTPTFTRLWRRYSELDETLISKKTMLKSLTFPLLVSSVKDDNLKVLSKDNQGFLLSASQRQTWSMFKSFRKLFSVPIVYCDSRNLPEDSVSGADVIERNFNARRQQVLANPSSAVSEIDIINYINKQTGMDRVRAIFDKE